MAGCWYEIDPESGETIRFAGGSPDYDADACYFDDGWVDAFNDHAWTFHEYLAAYSRPPLVDLTAFVVDGETPSSFSIFNDQTKVAEIQGAFVAFWREVDKEFQASFGRPARRVERYWIAHSHLVRMAVGREQFYKAKQVVTEEWFLHDLNLFFHKQCDWMRLRVFNDGSAAAWDFSIGVNGFDTEQSARHYVGEAHYVDLKTLRSNPQYGSLVPDEVPTDKHDASVPFRYFGKW